MRTRKARIADIPAIQNLIEHYAAQGTLLPRSEEDICRHLSGFLVAVEDAAIIGCVSLEWYSSALAEIRSLAVNWNGVCEGRARVGRKEKNRTNYRVDEFS